uniref:PD-(D/E)XK motif protein n=1 Tax=Marinobacterium profundum TaxID=1714300 RepID=UPI0008309CC2|nr:PD-(D/E)XK motif protein [Marinobacterium profundum]
MTEYTDPWKLMSPPDQAANVNGRRVDQDFPWSLFWAVDVDSKCLLIFQHDRLNRPSSRLPKLHGVEFETRTPDSGSRDILVIRLVDNEQREIFHRLCLDIISATKMARTEQEAIECFISRTWRWHRLLRGGRNDRLSDEEQKGLIGELLVLQNVLFPLVGVKASVQGWTGPLNAPKDFEIGRLCIEAKARRGAAKPFISISSEHQLDSEGVDALFIHVSEISAASEDDLQSITVTELARNIFEKIEALDIYTVEIFEERLIAAGFDWADNYTDKKWKSGAFSLFEVKGCFPRVTPSMYPSGVSNLRYAISLQDCEPFRSSEEKLKELILGALDGHQH